MAKSVVGSWAVDKLDRLSRYLNAYTTILTKQQWCEGYYYIDAFAGPGEHEVRSKPRGTRSSRDLFLDVASHGRVDEGQQQFLAGSPRVALDIANPFSAYVFVELSRSRVSALERLKSEYGATRTILVRNENCNEYLCAKVVHNPKVNWKTNRALVFLDPFGMQVPWNTLELLGSSGAIEVFLNLPVGMAIQRLIPRDPKKLSNKRRAMLDEYFGSPHWYEVVYKSSATLFDFDTEEKVSKSGALLLNWYRDRLKRAFGHTSKAALIRNSRGAHLYYLLLASPNKTGIKIADHILSVGETI